MDNKYGSVMIDGKRVDEWLLDVPFMNPKQGGELTGALYDYAMEIEEAGGPFVSETILGFEEVSTAIGARFDFFEKLINDEVDAGVASGKYVRAGFNVYERNVNGLLALRSIFGDTVTEVYVDRRYLEHKQHESKMFEEERIIKAVMNNDENLELDISNMNMVVKFADGRMIEMTNSEWGAFTRIQ